MGVGGYPGLSLDIDHDPATCAPADDCEEGIDNQFSGLLDDFKGIYDLSTEMNTELEDGHIIILAEFVNPDYEGKPFVLNLYWGDTTVDKGECNFQTSVCNYLVDPLSFKLEGCQAVVSLDNATIKNGKLKAGGKKFVMSSFIDLAEVPFQISLHMLHLEGDIPGAEVNDLTISNGVLAGAIPKDSIIDAIEQTPEEDLGVPKDMVLQLLNELLVNDMDSNDDGVNDALSAGFKFTTIQGHIVGLDR